MASGVNEIIKTVFGFESERIWRENDKGIVINFPVRKLIEIGKSNGMRFKGVEKRDGKLVYYYCFDNVDGKEIEVEVREKGERKLELEFEYGGEKFVFVEKV